MSIYASTLECRDKDGDTFDALYNKLESVIKNVKYRDNLVIACDFNPKIGTTALERNIYRKRLQYTEKKEQIANSYSLLGLAKSQSLKLTNTFFKHKQCHRSKWESPIKMLQSTTQDHTAEYVQNQIINSS